MIASFDGNPPLEFEHLYVDTIEDVCDWVDRERYFVVVRFGDKHYYCDKLDSYRFLDMTKEGWPPASGQFSSVVAALDYPLLDGKSIRERFDEVEFLTD